MKPSFIGHWRIMEMEQWDRDFLDMESPAHITFKSGGRGELHFGSVDVSMDWRTGAAGNRVDFTLEGFDEGDEVSGRGWAELGSGKITGRVFFHLGEESGFEARKPGKSRR